MKTRSMFLQTTEREAPRRIRRRAQRLGTYRGNGGIYLIRLILFTTLIILFIIIKHLNP